MLRPVHDIERIGGTLPSTCGPRQRSLLIRPPLGLMLVLMMPTMFRVWIYTFNRSSFALFQLFQLEVRWLRQIICWLSLFLRLIALIFSIVVLILWWMRWFILLQSSPILLLMGVREPDLLIALITNEFIFIIFLVIPVQLLYTDNLYQIFLHSHCRMCTYRTFQATEPAFHVLALGWLWQLPLSYHSY